MEKMQTLKDVFYDTFDDLTEKVDPDDNFRYFLIAAGILLAIWIFLKISDRFPKTSSESPTPNISTLGRASWTLLHTTAAKYPVKADGQTQKDMATYLYLFSKFYPCMECSKHMMDYMNKVSPKTEGRDSLQMWLCRLHNDVNAKLGKKQYDLSDISKINKRWGSNEGMCRGKCR